MLVKDRGTKEIPYEILLRPDLYPNPEKYTYKVHIINNIRHISLFPIMTEAELIAQDKRVKKCISDIIKSRPELLAYYKTNT